MFFFLLRPATDWTRPTHTMEGNPLYTKSADVNVNHFCKSTFTGTSGIMSEQIARCRGPVELTCKVNHRRPGFSPTYRDAALLDNQEVGSVIC